MQHPRTWYGPLLVGLGLLAAACDQPATPVPPAPAPALTVAVGYPRYGHAADYSWIAGVVRDEHWLRSGCLYIVYSAPTGPTLTPVPIPPSPFYSLTAVPNAGAPVPTVPAPPFLEVAPYGPLVYETAQRTIWTEGRFVVVFGVFEPNPPGVPKPAAPRRAVPPRTHPCHGPRYIVDRVEDQP